ncbi:hypothetical protein [Duganella sp. Leaf126]|uniref:hypothetical protein n=1 Tax=Duganella sp. Leaf126 TaxID=1736266 RepID=UPI0035A5EF16
MSNRDASQYVKPVKAQVASYPWKDEALPKIKNMSRHSFIVKGFDFSKKNRNRKAIKYQSIFPITAPSGDR